MKLPFRAAFASKWSLSNKPRKSRRIERRNSKGEVTASMGGEHRLLVPVGCAIVLALIQVIGLLSPLPVPKAYAYVTHNIVLGAAQDGQMAEHLGPNDTFVEMSYIRPWIQSDTGIRFKCMNPFQHADASAYMEYPIEYNLSDETTHYLACCVMWAEEKYGESVGGCLSQLIIWNRLIAEGRWPDHPNERYKFSVLNSDQMTAEFDAWYAKNGSDYNAGGTYLKNCSGVLDAQPLAMFWAKKKTGTLTVRKTSANPSLTDGNDRYSLSNAVFAVYADEQCTQRVEGIEDLVTNNQGTSQSVVIDVGTYWLKEESAPTGFALNEQPMMFTVTEGEESAITMPNQPNGGTHDLMVCKRDVKTATVAQGSATLSGAEFTVRYFPGVYDAGALPEEAEKTWVFASDERGRVPADEEHRVSGDDLYLTEQGSVFLPTGTYAIQETKAPEGYHLEGWVPGSLASYKAPVHVVVVGDDGTYAPPNIEDEIIFGGVRIQKVDTETRTKPQGDAHLEGAVFDIVLQGTQDTYVHDQLYGPSDVVMSITTDERGVAETQGRDLPYGSYVIRERVAPEGYAQNEEYSKAFEIRDEGVILNLRDDPCDDQVIRGGLAIQKVSRETGNPQGQGAARISGAVFSVTLESEQPVVVNGSKFNKGDVVCTLNTNDRGLAQTVENLLPYGTYTVRETEASKGFAINESWSRTFSIREDGEVHEFVSDQDRVEEQIVRGGLRFVKRDGTTGTSLAGIPFSIMSVTTGECHVVVSDKDGVVNTEAAPHDANTNQNDVALEEKGIIDASKLAAENGIWFHGNNEQNTEPNNEVCALPFDTYVVQELPVAANVSYELCSFTIVVDKADEVIDQGYVDNHPKGRHEPKVSTTLTHEQTGHVAPCAEEITLVDEVLFEGVEANEAYRLEGKLLSKDTGKPILGSDGQPIQSTLRFVPKQSAGVQRIAFVLDSRTLAGKSVVAEERLFLNDKEVASHCDLEDATQTVRFPSVGTTISEENDDMGSTVLTDKVEVHNLEPGATYVVDGLLMDKETGETYLNTSYEEVRGSKTFVAKESDEAVYVTFSVDTQDAAGKSLVAFEQLKRQDVVLASHEDINSQEQTARIVDLKTTLTDHQGHDVVAYQDTIELVDSVTYTGLEPGATYHLEGTLMDKATGGEVLDDGDKAISAVSEFTPEQASGTQLVTFTCNGRCLEGRVVVAFETLTQEGRQIASHKNIESEAQTVFVPKIGTTLTAKDGSHEIGIESAKNATLVDTIAYQGVRPGIPLCMVGSLMDANTKQPVNDSEGKPLQASVEFVPDSSNGTVEVTFSLNASELEGHRLVAFETLHETSVDGRVIASHEDWEDEGQSIWVGNRNAPSSNTEKNPSSTSRSSSKTPSTNDPTLAPVLSLLAGITLLVIAKTKII